MKKCSFCFLDGFIIFSRLTLLLDDLLWVLTVTQLKSAIIYANSLKNLVQKSSEESKKTMADELSVCVLCIRRLLRFAMVYV